MSPIFIPMKIILKGGLEQYFDNATTISIDKAQLSDNRLRRLKHVVHYLKEEYPSCDENLFQGMELAPGNLCIVNMQEYEINGGMESELEYGDDIYFISTMHGG